MAAPRLILNNKSDVVEFVTDSVWESLKYLVDEPFKEKASRAFGNAGMRISHTGILPFFPHQRPFFGPLAARSMGIS